MENFRNFVFSLIFSILLVSSAIIVFSNLALSQIETNLTTTCPATQTCPDGKTTVACKLVNNVCTCEPCPTTTTAICGNAVCEADETLTCPSDCKPKPCPLLPVPTCAEGQILKTKITAEGCPVSECVTVTEIVKCPEIPPPTISCLPDQKLSKLTDEKGCVVGYNCVGVPVETCPAIVAVKPECPEGSVSPIFDKGCLVGYTCLPHGCRQETDPSGFVRTICIQEKICPAELQQAELKTSCEAHGGKPVPFTDPRGCVFYDCRFEEKPIEIKPNPISGYLKCPTEDEKRTLISQCRDAGLSPSFSFEGGCKIVKCSQPIEPVCRFPAESEVNRVEGECRAQGLPTIKAVDENSCVYFRCGETPTACPREVPPEAFQKCDSVGGEMIVKTNEQDCVVFSSCILPGDVNLVHVEPVKEVPDTTLLLNLAIKLEQLKVELDKLAREATEIAKYYASVGSLDEERFKRVAAMFDSASDKVDEIKTKIRENLETLSPDDVAEIKHDIKYLKEVTLKDILYVMLSNSEDVRESLEVSKKISVRSSFEEIEQNAKNCGTDGFCFEKAFRICKPVTFRPEGFRGPVVTIVGLERNECVVKAMLPKEFGPPAGFIPGINPPYEMICRFPDYALGSGREPHDFISHCQGSMVEMMKRFGAGHVSGEPFPPPEGGPGGCKSVKECALYCIDNYEECVEWTKQHPGYGPPPTREQLRQIATSEFPEKFERKGIREFSGPGGCRGTIECDQYCRKNSEECLRWCKENPDICPRGFREEVVGEEFKRLPGEFIAPKPISRLPEGVQACVGCLNNGICDIGECSECIDCLKAGR